MNDHQILMPKSCYAKDNWEGHIAFWSSAMTFKIIIKTQ